MGTRHDQQERDIELNDVTERSESQHHHNSKNATSSYLNKSIKRAIVHYHCALTTNQLYLFLFTVGVSMDTLFLFIPNINKDKRCVIIENDVKIIALVLRSITDIFFLERISYKVLVGFDQPKSSWVYYFDILIDILGVVPLPQIFGSFWYFFAVQQEVSCLYEACTTRAIDCVHSIFHCKDNITKNLTIISNLCSVNQPDTKDFGIYTEAIKTGLLLVTKDIPSKIIHSFWWGLRNLSTCGQNLQSSGYVWETCFGALITTFGLVLFLYFIGQVQVYIEVLTCAISTKEKWLGMKYRKIDVDVWLNNNNIPDKDKIKKTLMRKIRCTPEIKDIHLKILLSLLSAQERRSIKNLFCHPILKKVAALQDVNNKLLEEITFYLKPVIYSENSYIIREGKPLDFMLLIAQGVIWNFKPSVGNNNSVNIMSNCRCISEGNVYGEELLEWIFKSAFHRVGSDSDFFISDTNVKAHTKVEAFAIMAKDIRIIANRFKIRIMHNLAKSRKFDLKLAESIAASLIQSTVRCRHRRCDQNKQL